MNDYFVRGADGVDYPASLEDVRAWLGQGRVTREQHVYDAKASKWMTVGEVLTPPSVPEPFFVRGADGADYPADLASLQAWAAQGRLAPQQLVYDPRAAQWVAAESVVGAPAFAQQRVAAAPKRGGALRVVVVLFAVLLIAVVVYTCASVIRKSLSERPGAPEAESSSVPAARSLPLNQWVNDGPYAADVELLVSSPRDANDVLAGAANSVFLSTDAAGSWKRVLLRPGFDVKAICFSADGKSAYAGGATLFRSADEGATWTEVPEIRDVTGLASGGNAVYALADRDVFVSEDGGATWAKHAIPGEGYDLALAALGERVFVAVRSALYESGDGGSTWRRLSIPEKDVQEIAVLEPSTLFVTTVEGLQRGTNFGATWNAVPKFATTKVYDVRTAGQNVVIVQSDEGYFRSEDAGATWKQMTAAGERPLNTVTVSARAPMTVIASAHDNRVYKSTDGGSQWTMASRGLAGSEINRIVPLSGGGVAVETRADIDIASRTEGWRNVLHVPTLSFSEAVMRLDAGGDHLYAIRGLFGQRVERSTDGGKTWSAWGPPETFALARDPQVPARTYASTQQGLKVTNDAGGTWESVSPAKWSDLLFSRDGRTIYAHVAGESAIQQSSDGGRTWRAFNDPGLSYHSVVTGDGRVCTAIPQAVVCSDGTETERFEGNGLPGDEIVAVAAHPSNPKVLLAGTAKTGVFVTRDGGATWTPLGPENGPMHVKQIVFDEEDPSYVHVATAGESVFALRTTWE